jgi:subtilisin family serine protease
MRKKILEICICLILIIIIAPPTTGLISKWENEPTRVYRNTDTKFVPGEIIVKLKHDSIIRATSLQKLNKKYHVSACEKLFPNANGTILNAIYLLHVPIESDIVSIMQDYMVCPDVEYAEPNGFVTLCSLPNDANFSNQWYLHNTGQILSRGVSGTPDADIDAPEAWDLEKGRSDVVIAIIDTGIDYSHPDLVSKIWNNTDEIPNNGIDDDTNGYIDDVMGWNFYNNTNELKDYIGHGTMCAGVAGAATDNRIGIAGIGWNCTIMSVKETFFLMEINWTAIAQGIRYATDNGADIISMSFGTFYPTFVVMDAVNYAYERGVFLCASAGNANAHLRSYPAAYNHVVAVAASNQNDERCTPRDWGYNFGSNYGHWVDIAAPGHLIYTTIPTYFRQNYSGNYTYTMGTSFSCPLVAGVAALLLSVDTSLSPDEVKILLCKNVDPYHSFRYIGTGRVNAYKALADLLSDIEISIKGGFGFKAIITNTGPSDLTDVHWRIHLNGGIFGMINKTINGTMDFKTGESKTVSTGLLFGHGNMIIDVKADIVERTVEGRQFSLFSFVK